MELAGQVERTQPSGHAELDRALPGGGWPVGSLVEVLQPAGAAHEWQLVLPGLAGLPEGPVVLVGSPWEPFGAALEAQGLPLLRILRIDAEKPAARLWACEQALRCREVSAVLAWLPQVRQPELRRLHLAASLHAKLLFAFRPLAARGESSPARVRLALRAEGDALSVEVLKRRGPPLASPLQLPLHPPRLAALLAARSRRGETTPISPLHPERSHVLDRASAIA